MTPMNTILQAEYSIELLRAYLESYSHQSHLEVISATHSQDFPKHAPSLGSPSWPIIAFQELNSQDTASPTFPLCPLQLHLYYGGNGYGW